jgi:hypothetical protein
MPKEFPVDREHVKGAADKAKGAIKDTLPINRQNPNSTSR